MYMCVCVAWWAGIRAASPLIQVRAMGEQARLPCSVSARAVCAARTLLDIFIASDETFVSSRCWL